LSATTHQATSGSSYRCSLLRHLEGLRPS